MYILNKMKEGDGKSGRMGLSVVNGWESFPREVMLNWEQSKEEKQSCTSEGGCRVYQCMVSSANALR